MTVLVDSSVWVGYFRGQQETKWMDGLVDEGLIAVNDLILSELLPFLVVRKQGRLISLLEEVPRLPLTIDWREIVEYQVTCLRHGINRVGIPDLLIAQNAIQHGASLFTMDKHFRLMAQHIPLTVQ